MIYGYRCTKAQPEHRMFADHVIELRDGGAQFDPANGQCLCGPHHLMKTAQTRRDRLAASRGDQIIEGFRAITSHVPFTERVFSGFFRAIR
jgi:hypothetical protein